MAKEDGTIRVSCICEGSKPKIKTVDRNIVKTILYLSKGRNLPIPLLLEGLNNPLVGLIRPYGRTILLTFSPGSVAWGFLDQLELVQRVNPENQQVYFTLIEKTERKE